MGDSKLRIVISALDQASKELKELENELKELGGSSKQSGKEVKSFEDNIAAFKKEALVAAGVVAGFGFAVKKAYDFSKDGAQLDRLAEASGDFARSLGANMDEVATRVKAASLGTVSDMDIIQASSRAMSLQVSASASELAELMEIAALKGRRMGMTTTEAFNDMVTGIGRVSPLILDNLGILTESEKTYKAYAESIGIGAEKLTDAQKRQALLNKVLQEGRAELAAVGGLALDAAGEYEKFEASLKNLADRFKQDLMPVVLPFIKAMNEQLDITLLVDGAARKHLITQEEKILLISQLRQGIIELSVVEEQLAQKEIDLREATGDHVITRWEMADATAANTEATNELIAAQERFGLTTQIVSASVKGELGETWSDYHSEIKDLATEHDELSEELQDLLDKGWSPMSKKVQDLNTALDENEEKQRAAADAAREATTQFIYQQAAAGLDAEAQLALARDMGILEEDTYTTITAIEEMKKIMDENKDGTLSAAEATNGYNEAVLLLQQYINGLEGKYVAIVIDIITRGRTEYLSIFDPGGITEKPGFNLALALQSGVGMAEGGSFVVPPGYDHDTYGPFWFSSGERVDVTPDWGAIMADRFGSNNSGGGGGGGNYSPTFNFRDRDLTIYELERVLRREMATVK